MNVVETRVNGLIVESKTQQNIVILREVDGERILPIWIGPSEAMAIRRILSEDPFPRPLTHDLLFLVVEGLKANTDMFCVVTSDNSSFNLTARMDTPIGHKIALTDIRPGPPTRSRWLCARARPSS